MEKKQKRSTAVGKVNRSSIFLGVWMLVLVSCALQPPATDGKIQAAAVAVEGWAPWRLDAAFDLARTYGTGTLIVTTNGKTVRAMGDITTPHRVHSIRKALLSALVGQHQGTGPGKIDLDATLADLGIDDRPVPLTPLQKQATVRHLIKSVSGINHGAAGEVPSMTAAKQRRLGDAPNIPGKVWAYNNWDYNALTTIFEQSTGLRVAHAFLRGIAVPLGMQDFSLDAVFYSRDRSLSMHAKAGFRMSARDLAAFGRLYLNKGRWNGQQILPDDWAARITADFTPTGERRLRSGHGYLWWVPCDRESKAAGIPEGTFMASGFGGQRIVVIPAWQTVIVHTVFTDDYFGFCADWAKSRGFSLDQAATYSRTRCRMPEHSAEPFCRRCRYYSGGDFFVLLKKIIAARSDR